ncbi:MAG: hypothetical protein LC104_17905 [Bacteroidales bacterium]|nr:hypothetical protein [Bacteroidales bacterium]
MTVTAPSLEERLTTQIHRRTSRRVRDLAVEVLNETVVVSGVAPSFHVKQLALHAVRELLPNSSFRNRIEVAEPSIAS